MRRMFSEKQVKNIVNQGIESGEIIEKSPKLTIEAGTQDDLYIKVPDGYLINNIWVSTDNGDLFVFLSLDQNDMALKYLVNAPDFENASIQYYNKQILIEYLIEGFTDFEIKGFSYEKVVGDINPLMYQ